MCEIPEKMLDVISNKLQLSSTENGEMQKKLAELKNQLLTSQATIYCEDCGLVFYSGLVAPIINEQNFVDWMMLSFRHVWDTQHKVKIYLPFFLAANQMLFKGNKYLANVQKTIRMQALGFDKSEQVCYYLEVEKKRERLKLSGSPRASMSNDENWDSGSRCVCSICHKQYYNPKDACLCHAEQKPWLPMTEVNSIKVRRLR